MAGRSSLRSLGRHWPRFLIQVIYIYIQIALCVTVRTYETASERRAVVRLGGVLFANVGRGTAVCFGSSMVA